ncbi:hypothetical protein Pmani_003925 [Petrolisthes manimaculis]|uniref:Sushi domain-containing protein n=1 Tax=Petrolisthes manimaculis TaxID=1843537 RepID=A0AAE1UPH4_9EUCA|nr:hypothetical protein Pmani_003925 [Petrolisthes manimaculis]
MKEICWCRFLLSIFVLLICIVWSLARDCRTPDSGGNDVTRTWDGSKTKDSTVTYSCPDGQTLGNSGQQRVTFTCSRNRWRADDSRTQMWNSCKDKPCDPAPDAPDNAYQSYSTSSSASYRCDWGLEFPSGVDRLTAECEGGEWVFSAPLEPCQEPPPCPASPPAPANAVKMVDEPLKAWYTCEGPFAFPSGRYYISAYCYSWNGGEWSWYGGPLEDCPAEMCPNDPPDAGISGATMAWDGGKGKGVEAKYECESGTEFFPGVNETTAVCSRHYRRGMEWVFPSLVSPLIHSCTERQTSPPTPCITTPDTPINVMVTFSSQYYISYSCSSPGETFPLGGIYVTATCEDNNIWTFFPEPLSPCLVLECIDDPPPAPAEAKREWEGNTLGTRALYSCQDPAQDDTVVVLLCSVNSNTSSTSLLDWLPLTASQLPSHLACFVDFNSTDTTTTMAITDTTNTITDTTNTITDTTNTITDTTNTITDTTIQSEECTEDPWLPSLPGVVQEWDGNRTEGTDITYSCGPDGVFCSGEHTLTLTCSSPYNNSRLIWMSVNASHPASVSCVDKPTITCPENYKYDDHRCYSLVNFSLALTPAEASSHCYSQGAMLALPHTLDHLIFLHYLIYQAGAEHVGLGLHNRNDPRFEWNQTEPHEEVKAQGDGRYTILNSTSLHSTTVHSTDLPLTHYICQYPAHTECQEDPWTPTTDDGGVMVWWDGNREEEAQAYYTCGHGNAFCSGGNVLTLTCSSLNITSTSSSSSSSSRPIWIPDTFHPANLTCVDVTLTCPVNYTCYDGLCYRLMTPGTDWYANEALKECGSEGGMLAAPTTNIQITFLQHLLLQAGVEEAGLGLSDRNDFGYEWEGVYNQSGEVEVKKEHPWITAQFTVLYTNSSKILGFLSNERRSHYICQYPGVVDCQRPPPLPTTADDTPPELNHDGDLSFLSTATYTCPQGKVFKARLGFRVGFILHIRPLTHFSPRHTEPQGS